MQEQVKVHKIDKFRDIGDWSSSITLSRGGLHDQAWRLLCNQSYVALQYWFTVPGPQFGLGLNLNALQQIKAVCNDTVTFAKECKREREGNKEESKEDRRSTDVTALCFLHYRGLCVVGVRTGLYIHHFYSHSQLRKGVGPSGQPDTMQLYQRFISSSSGKLKKVPCYLF